MICSPQRYLDYVNVMSFDYHMFDDGPYLYHHSGMDNTNTANDKDNNNNIVIINLVFFFKLSYIN